MFETVLEILEFKVRTLSTPSEFSIFWSNFQVLISPVQLPKDMNISDINDILQFLRLISILYK